MTKYFFIEIKFNETIFVFNYTLECEVRKDKVYQIWNNELDVIGIGSTLKKAIEDFKEDFYEMWIQCNSKELAPSFQKECENNLKKLIKSIEHDK